MITLVIATRNTHKVQEIQAILSGPFRYLSLKEFPGAPAIAEDADTFAGNAAKKAVGLAQWLAETSMVETSSPEGSTFVLADDSGLEVDALRGAPGVHSARFAALEEASAIGLAIAASENTSDAANNAKLLRLLNAVPLEQRTARFRCVLALVEVSPSTASISGAKSGPHVPYFFEGACEGHVGFAPRGDRGFGYDPLFVPRNHRQSFAELGEQVKNQLSHRAQALAKLRAWLSERITAGP